MAVIDAYKKWIGKITVAYWRNVTPNGKITARRTKERDKYLFNGLKNDYTDQVALIECPPDVEIRYINMPVFMGPSRPFKSIALR